MPMRLLFKLTLAVATAVLVVLAVHGYLRVERERELFTRDIERHHRSVGLAVAGAMEEMAASHGEEEAIALLSRIDERASHVRIDWEAGTSAHGTREVEADGGQLMVTRLPLRLPSGPATLELRESLEPRVAYVRATITRVALVVALTIAICTLLIAALMWIFVSRPLRTLSDRFAAVGAGDLGVRVELNQRDEIGELAKRFNRMCELLGEARADADEQTRARLSTLEELRHADRLATVGTLSAGVAHELGTPLNVIAGRARMVERGESTGDDVTRDAHIIVEQSERITRIIRQLLDFARRGQPHEEPVDLGDLITTSVALLDALARKSRVELLVTSGSETVSADPEQLKQMVTNLLLNAIQAQPTGGQVRVSMARCEAGSPDESAQQRSHVRLDVVDAGSGIPDNVKERIFEPFYTTKPVGHGTGLGLSVAYGIARDHRGWIEVHSEPGGGSRFSVYLPLGTS